jgi:hypothetical protein
MNQGNEFRPLQAVRTISIRDRTHKVHVGDFARVPSTPDGSGLSELIPKIGSGLAIRKLLDAWVEARTRRRGNIFAFGAHVIKCGLSPILIELMRRRCITGVVLNGAGAIHDFELAMVGQTSEDVANGLPTGAFGMVEETPVRLHAALARQNAAKIGLGAALGKELASGGYRHGDSSLLANAFELDIPTTVHVAFGADTLHMHPTFDPALVGSATHHDFQKLATELVSLGGGGTYWNVGSAVFLPEVFLKALTLARNIGHEVSGFVTVNLDMISSYRARENVVRRPTLINGKGYELIGQHELMLPLLYTLMVQRLTEADTEPSNAALVESEPSRAK